MVCNLRLSRSSLVPALVVISVVICVVLTVYGWDWLTEEGEEIRSTVIRNSILAAGAVTALLITIWRSRIAENQLGIAQEQSAIAQRSHLHERYQNASEMLGSKVLSIRIGAIHALDQLARDYPNEFHIQVMRLFAAFVRHPVVYGAPLPTIDSDNDVTPPSSPREDIQIIMVNIAARNLTGQELESDGGYVLDLRGADLSNVWFPNPTCLERVRISGANLTGVIGLSQCELNEAMAPADNPPTIARANSRGTLDPLYWPRFPNRGD